MLPLSEMLSYGLEGFFGDNMLDFTGILRGDFTVYTKSGKSSGKNCMSFVESFGDFSARI